MMDMRPAQRVGCSYLTYLTPNPPHDLPQALVVFDDQGAHGDTLRRRGAAGPAGASNCWYHSAGPPSIHPTEKDAMTTADQKQAMTQPSAASPNPFAVAYLQLCEVSYFDPAPIVAGVAALPPLDATGSGQGVWGARSGEKHSET